MLTTVSTYQNNDEIALPLSSDQVKERKICAFINEYEPIFLLNALGKEVMDLFDAGITASEQRWLDLRDGVTYTVNDKDIRFAGIKPLIARYIYCFYLDHEFSTTTLTGEKKEAVANATNVHNGKVLRQWNKMSRGMEDLWDFLYYCVDGDGDRVYSEFLTSTPNIEHFRSRNQYGI